MTEQLLPKLFVVSSREGLPVARALQRGLAADANVALWDQVLLDMSHGLMESLLAAVGRFDFATVILTPDDDLKSRHASTRVPRDNVLFELGLLVGRFGRDRVFVLVDEAANIPTDLQGINVARYTLNADAVSIDSSLGPACDRVRSQIRSNWSGVQQAASAAQSDCQGNVVLRGRSEILNIEELAEGSSQIWVSGPTLISLLTLHHAFFEQSLRQGSQIQFLLLKPDSLGMKIWLEAQRLAVPEDSDISLKMIRWIQQESVCGGRCELRLSSIYPPYSMVIVDPRSEQGRMVVELLATQRPLWERPHFRLTQRENGRWFDFFVAQHEILWSKAERFE